MTLDVDGHSAVVSTTAGSVGELLDSEHISHAAGTEVKPGLNVPIYAHQQIEVDHAWKITVKVAGKTQSKWTTADSVGAALNEMGIKVGPNDKVSVPLTSGHKNMTVVIKRGKVKEMNLRVILDKHVQQVPDAGLIQGTTKVVQAGHDGVEHRVVKVDWVDGKLDHIKVLSRKVTVQPVTEVVAVGTKPAPAPAPRACRPGSACRPGRVFGHERCLGTGRAMRDRWKPEHRRRPVLRHVHDDAGRVARRRWHRPAEPGLRGRADRAGAEPVQPARQQAVAGVREVPALTRRP